jgi:hypothetical protein
MTRDLNGIVEHLKWLIFWIRHCPDQAEAKWNEVNQLLPQLGKPTLVHRSVVLGEVIHHCDYSPQHEGHDSSQLVQADLGLPVGIASFSGTVKNIERCGTNRIVLKQRLRWVSSRSSGARRRSKPCCCHILSRCCSS